MSPLRAPAVSVVMGIPSVRREVHSYLTDTLHSLISELSPQEKEDSVIVVLIAEASGPVWFDRAHSEERPIETPRTTNMEHSPSNHFPVRYTEAQPAELGR